MSAFTKSHGLGNDYLVVDPAGLPFALTPARVRLLCDRHEGVGSDGILALAGASEAGYGLVIWNPDGSRAEKSGNGIRIFARWLFDGGRTGGATRFVVDTPGGRVPVEVEARDGAGRVVVAGMGRPAFRDDLTEVEVDGTRLPVVAVSMGNPHCVVPRARLDPADLRRLGPLVETHPAFPERTNVQLARFVDRDRVEALVWERGAGETRASGSSACAVVAAGQRLGLLDAAATVSMPGGDLHVRLADGSLWLRGPVEEVGRVTLSPDLEARLRALP